MPEETGETLSETWGNKRGNEGKHVGNCCLWGFLRHLATSSQAPSYIDRTAPECWGISIVFPLTFFFVRPSEISVHSNMAESLDVPSS